MLTSEERRKLGKIASQTTQEKAKQERLRLYSVAASKCKHCAQLLSYVKRKNLFCDTSCAAQYNNARRARRFPLVHCKHCAKEIKSVDRLIRKYCSNRCQKDYEWVLRKEGIELSGTFGSGDQSVRMVAKKYLIEKFGHKCMICGISEWLAKPIMLISDHINGYSLDNSIKNIRVICSNCDATLPTYKSKNRGKERHPAREANRPKSRSRVSAPSRA